MADELLIPQVPDAKPDDSEDVSWALSTAEAMWARGDHADGIKWVRKAAEAASDADQDARALELAKAASELASLLARRSAADESDRHAALNEGRAAPAPAAPTTTTSSPPPATRSAPPPSATTSSPPPTARASVSPPQPQAPQQQALPKPQAARSSPPLPSSTSQPPPPGAGQKAPRPFAGPTARISGLPPAKSVAPARAAEAKKARRRSRDNFDEEARLASLPPVPDRETARDVAGMIGATDKTTEVPALRMQAPVDRTFDDGPTSRRRRSRPDEATPARPSVAPPRPGPPAHFADEVPTAAGGAARTSAAPARAPRGPDWDASPTQALSSSDLQDLADAEARTTMAATPAAAATGAGAPAPRSGSVRPPSKTVHDEDIRTSQAVRVVVWRDAGGVHVAPAGTVVSAITIDALLVAVDPAADLTAWLSRRQR